MNKVGIFLGYSSETSIKKEGLGRLLAFVIKGIQAGESELVIACPQWFQIHLEELLEDHNIPLSNIELLMTEGIPLAVRLRRKKSSKRKSLFDYVEGFKSSLITFAKKRVLKVAVANKSYKLFQPLIELLLFFIGLLTFALLFLPVFLPYLIYRLLPLNIKNLITMPYRIVTGSLSSIRNNVLAIEGSELLIESELDELICKINTRTDIGQWFVPTLFWPEIGKINARKIVVSPDLVLNEMPSHFVYPWVENVVSKLEAAAYSADKLITYSEYVKEKHLGKFLGIDRKNVTVINHGRVSLKEYLLLGNKKQTLDETRKVALSILRDYFIQHQNVFWSSVDFEHINYIFYSSQYRPYKNIFALVRCVENINREQGINLKLVLTCSIEHAPEIINFISENNMHSKVLIAHNLSSKELAAFNALASLSVNPSLFEGGMPFTFCEAYSVGTPSIMGDIPVTREILTKRTPHLLDSMLFDPYSDYDMVNKIIWGLENKEQLFKEQKELFDKFPSWDEVAARYIEEILGE